MQGKSKRGKSTGQVSISRGKAALAMSNDEIGLANAGQSHRNASKAFRRWCRSSSAANDALSLLCPYCSAL